MKPSQAFLIGYNGYGDLGGDLDQQQKSLKPFPKKSISKALSGNAHSLYADHKSQNVLSAGYNARGSCGVAINENRTIYTNNLFQ